MEKINLTVGKIFNIECNFMLLCHIKILDTITTFISS